MVHGNKTLDENVWVDSRYGCAEYHASFISKTSWET
jgi:hypothetical protein